MNNNIAGIAGLGIVGSYLYQKNNSPERDPMNSGNGGKRSRRSKRKIK
jgi:hypothetical protein